jgi:uncharacterized protein with NRDE domain
MCTVVVRWAPGRPVEALALRDELLGRAFDGPGAWWPEQPSVVGGRDRVAGGSWCVTDVDGGTTALVLNRPQRRVAADGAPSRGVLPLLGVQHGRQWPGHVDVTGMASFALLLAAPDALTLWEYDGEQLTESALDAGTHMVTSGGAEDGKAPRYLSAFAAESSVEGWRGIVTAQRPTDDAAALVVRHEMADAVYATVFGQTIVSSPGALALHWSRTPWEADSWT